MTEYSEPKLRRMLSSLPRSRMVVVISYGYIGRSHRQASTANASGLDTARFVMLASGIDYSIQSIRNGVLCPECRAEERELASSDDEGAEEDRLHRRRRGRRSELPLQPFGRRADECSEVGRAPAQLVGDRIAEDQPVGKVCPGCDGRVMRN